MSYFEKIQPLTYTVLQDFTASPDGLNVKEYKRGEIVTARTRSELILFAGFAQSKHLEIGALSLVDRETKVTRPARAK